MERKAMTLAALLVGAGMLLFGMNAVDAHECGYDEDNPDECRPTGVAPNWRDNYVPLFDLEDREDEEQRREAQRWRDEWGCEGQFCVWLDLTFSARGGPNSIHGGTAGNHALGEAAHESDDHRPMEPYQNENNHDAHGGAVYFDICLGSDEGTSYEGRAGWCRGMEDTQVGITVMDHFGCGVIVPVASCTDEYYLIRPLDQEYTERQMENSQSSIQMIIDNPRRHFCGYGPGSQNCILNPILPPPEED